MPVFNVESQEAWLKLREENIGASEVAALFNLSPYTTLFQLWHLKKKNVLAPDFNSERIKWGTRLESAIAMGIAEDKGWQIRKVHRYLTHDKIPGMGASLDYEIVNHPDGAGCLEIKNTDSLVFKKGWWQGHELEAPIHIELQLQHQLAVTGRSWGAIGVLSGGNESHVIIRPRHDEIIEKIELAVIRFWQSIQHNIEPEPFNEKDYETVNQLIGPSVEGRGLDFYTPEAKGLCAEILNLQKQSSETTKALKTAKAKLLHLIGDAEIARTDGFFITSKMVERKGYTTQDTTYRDLRIKEMK